MTWNVVRTLTTQNGVGDMACTRGGFTRGVEGAPGGDLPSASRTPGRPLRRHMEAVAACPPPHAQAALAPPRPACRPLVLPLLVALARTWRLPPLLCVRPHQPGEAALETPDAHDPG